jgi:Tfp pilus assembly protein PilF
VLAAKTQDDLDGAYGLMLDVAQAGDKLKLQETIYRRSLEAEPDSAWTLGNYATLMMNTGRADQALDTIYKALRLMDYGVGHSIRATILVDLATTALWDHRDPQKAREHLEWAVKEDPRNLDARYGLVAVDWFEASGAGKKCEDCIDRLEALQKENKDHWPTKTALAYLQRQ